MGTLSLRVRAVESGKDLTEYQIRKVEYILRKEQVHTLIVEAGKVSYVREEFCRKIRTVRRS